MEIFTVILGIICIVVFFIMAAALSNISKRLLRMSAIMETWAAASGYGTTYQCTNCKKNYTGRLSKCPHCGEAKSYKDDADRFWTGDKKE